LTEAAAKKFAAQEVHPVEARLAMTSRTKARCAWAGDDPLMQAYHDQEWGVPQRDSRALWEMLMLEGFQAGLSWAIVLRKREAIREAFAGFDPNRVARFTKRDVDRLMTNSGIIRARAKIDATIAGARAFCEMRDRGEDFADFCWSFSDGHVVAGGGRSFPAQTALSDTISKDLKRRGFKFVGPTIVYAWMQAVGIVNDHSINCFRRNQVARGFFRSEAFARRAASLSGRS
jgi:DNA-3-methyladenine glycosylase I